MRCFLFHADIAQLIAVLSGSDLLSQWQQALAEELPSLADRPLLAHLKRLNLTASSILGCGFARAARLDPQAVDALLSDVFAVATWRGWPLPIEAEAEQEVIIDGVPRGLLGVDTSPGAGVWRIDHRTLALARQCQAADQADWSSHMLKH